MILFSLPVQNIFLYTVALLLFPHKSAEVLQTASVLLLKVVLLPVSCQKLIFRLRMHSVLTESVRIFTPFCSILYYIKQFQNLQDSPALSVLIILLLLFCFINVDYRLNRHWIDHYYMIYQDKYFI